MFKDLFHASGDDASVRVLGFELETLHCVCFAGSSLTIGQDSRVVAFQYTHHGTTSRVFVDLLLCAVRPIDSVEGECMLCVKIWIAQGVHPFFEVVELIERDLSVVVRQLDLL